MMSFPLAALLFLLLIEWVLMGSASSSTTKRSTQEDSLLFLAIGDWGGTSDEEPTSPSELDNSRGMAKAVQSILSTSTKPMKADFVLALGDNFYSHGIQSNEHSSRFQETFEGVFVEKELQCPWYAVAGNHDHLGNVTAQIEYGRMNTTTRWTMPDLNYTIRYPQTHPSKEAQKEEAVTATDSTEKENENDSNSKLQKTLRQKQAKIPTTQIVYIDTVTFAGIHHRNEHPDRPPSKLYQPHIRQTTHFASQYQWLEQTLREASEVDFLWIAGHYPMYSHCWHGPTVELQNALWDLMVRYNVNGYISGHDHCLSYYKQHHQRSHHPSSRQDLHFIVAGAGKECCYEPFNIHNPKNPGKPLFRMDSRVRPENANGGFASFHVLHDKNITTVRFHSDDGTVLYESNVTARTASSSSMTSTAPVTFAVES